jgi:ribosomal protein S18 acetylase RimI-like enzyme
MDAKNQSCALRPSNNADYDAIAEVWHSSASMPGVGPPVMPSLSELRERIDLEFAAGWSVAVAVRGDDVVGFVAMKPGEAVLDQLFVRPGSIGGGVGQALLAHAKAAMPDGFTLFTRPANTRARRFYEKAGLVVLRADTHPRTGDPIIYYGWNAR